MSFLLVFSRFSMCYAAKCLINKIRRFSLRCFSRLTTFREFPNYNYSEQILIFRDSSKQLLPSQSLISTSSLLTETNGSLFLLMLLLCSFNFHDISLKSSKSRMLSCSLVSVFKHGLKRKYLEANVKHTCQSQLRSTVYIGPAYLR